ncbi:MAG: hypothetical protein WA652_11640, partial [Xanthobacteraceae bacterium]
MTEPSRRNAIRRRPSVDAMHRYLPGIMVHVALVAACYAFVTYGHVPSFVMPSPIATLETLGVTNYAWIDNPLVTA